jgi:hypothetical protein
MIAMAERWGLQYLVYSNLSPTIYGGSEVLPAQSVEHLKSRKPFSGCNAGHTFFHVDPHGKAGICKVGRDPSVDLPNDGVDGLRRLGGIADSLMLRTGFGRPVLASTLSNSYSMDFWRVMRAAA